MTNTMTGGSTFSELLQNLSKSKDTTEIVKIQKNTLRRYEETNEMMRQFLELSDVTHKMLLENFTTHSKTLGALKRDLEMTFKRIRVLKEKLKEKHPEAFEATSDAMRELEARYEHEDHERFSVTHTQYPIENATSAQEDRDIIAPSQTDLQIESESYDENTRHNIENTLAKAVEHEAKDILLQGDSDETTPLDTITSRLLTTNLVEITETETASDNIVNIDTSIS